MEQGEERNSRQLSTWRDMELTLEEDFYMIDRTVGTCIIKHAAVDQHLNFETGVLVPGLICSRVLFRFF